MKILKLPKNKLEYTRLIIEHPVTIQLRYSDVITQGFLAPGIYIEKDRVYAANGFTIPRGVAGRIWFEDVK
jgi:hypothetical protein